MIVEGTLCVCHFCGGLVPVLGSIDGVIVDAANAEIHIHWSHGCEADASGCRTLSVPEFRRLKDFINRSQYADDVRSAGDLLVAGFSAKLSDVEDLEDLEALWQSVS